MSAFGNCFDLFSRAEHLDEKKKKMEDQLPRRMRLHEVFILSVIVALLASSYVIAFSAYLGYGLEVHKFLSHGNQHEFKFLAGGVLFFILLFLSDAFTSWKEIFSASKI